jgi:hypothetical protein
MSWLLGKEGGQHGQVDAQRANYIAAIKELQKKIKILEEERDMAENFKRSLRETLGLQVESLTTELELEREKVKRLQDEMSLRSQEDRALSLANQHDGSSISYITNISKEVTQRRSITKHYRS